jgi:hypothetical protein
LRPIQLQMPNSQGYLLQLILEVGHVQVAVHVAARAAEPDPVDDARVVERVRDDCVVGTQQRLKQPRIGVKAAAIQDGVLGPVVARDAVLELAVQGRGPADAEARKPYRSREPLTIGRLRPMRLPRNSYNSPFFENARSTCGWLPKPR